MVKHVTLIFCEDISKVVQSPEFGLFVIILKDFFDVAQIKTVQFTLVIRELPQTSLKTAEDRLSGGNLMITFNMWGNVQNLITILDTFDYYKINVVCFLNSINKEKRVLGEL